MRAKTLPTDNVQAGRRVGEREARRARAHETEQRVNKEVGTLAFRSRIADYETSFTTKLRVFIKGALSGHEQVCLELVSLGHQQRRHQQCAVPLPMKTMCMCDMLHASAELRDMHHDEASRDRSDSREKLDGILNLIERLDFNHYLSQRQGCSELLAAPL